MSAIFSTPTLAFLHLGDSSQFFVGISRNCKKFHEIASNSREILLFRKNMLFINRCIRKMIHFDIIHYLNSASKHCLMPRLRNWSERLLKLASVLWSWALEVDDFWGTFKMVPHYLTIFLQEGKRNKCRYFCMSTIDRETHERRGPPLKISNETATIMRCFRQREYLKMSMLRVSRISENVLLLENALSLYEFVLW